MATEWLELYFTVSAAQEEALTECMYELGIPGWELLEAEPSSGSNQEDSPAEPPRMIRVWVLPEEKSKLQEGLAALSIDLQSDRLLSDAPWTEDWAPECIPPFVVTSLGAPTPTIAPHEHLITLAPALAFGGGEHPTTRLCLMVLPEVVVPGSFVLDVGCGSGILSIAAAKLGASDVHALDINTTAQTATMRGAEASQVRVKVLEHGFEQAQSQYNLIVANILSPTLIELSSLLQTHRAPDGKILLSGIRSGTETEVRNHYRSLSVEGQWEQEGWVAMLLSNSLVK